MGGVPGIRDVIGFHGKSVRELRAALRESVDDYLSACNKLSKQPNHPCSGQLPLPLQPARHARTALIAQTQGESLNAWVSETIASHVAGPQKPAPAAQRATSTRSQPSDFA